MRVTENVDTLAHDAAPIGTVSAGTLLRAGREAAGLTVAAVSQQLKLAPRQIAALEEGDFAKLPGRTFIRGFVRNYARLLRLDSDAVLAALPEAAASAAYENPSLAPTPRPMGELPADVPSRPSPARWAIPLALVAVVAVAAIYEIARPPVPPTPQVATGRPATPMVQVAPIAAPVPATAPGNTTTTLPNPLAGAGDKAFAPAENVGTGTGTAEPPIATSPNPEATNAPIILTFVGTSWVEVRDGTGTLVVSVTGNAGGAQEVNGRAPFEVILGNAAAVNVSWQGKTFDTAPFTRQNVAKFTLR
jgi:cytoskeleton protein RodZ